MFLLLGGETKIQVPIFVRLLNSPLVASCHFDLSGDLMACL